MHEQTIVAVYETAAQADAAMKDMVAAHVPSDAIGRHAKSMMSGGTTASWEHKPGFWESLFGGSMDHDPMIYDRSIEGGSTVITVKVPDEHYDAVSAILERHHPVDLEERTAHYMSTQTTTGTQGDTVVAGGRTGTMATGVGAMGTDAMARGAMKSDVMKPDTRTDTLKTGTMATGTARTGDETIQLAEEKLAIGKRAIVGGTTRVRRYVVETPVEEKVTLHEEKVTIDRRPVTDGRPVTAAEFTDKTIEMTESREEAVVSKIAHVKEEITLRKEATERVETVKDTVRREEVKVETVPGQVASTTTTTRTDKPTSTPMPQNTKI